MNCNDMTMSPQGQRFLYAHEAERGVSNRLYWPGGNSGVTLGAGYDMKQRSRENIDATMTSLGLPSYKSTEISAAAGLAGGAAEEFVCGNKDLVDLSEAQELALMLIILPPYEATVRSEIRIPLQQHQFDALVSVAYNPGGSFRDIAGLINMGHTELALTRLRGRVFSGRRRLDGLVRRRNDETVLFQTGRY